MLGTIASLWPKYCLCLALFLLHQSLVSLGIPLPCGANPTLISWLSLPEFFRAPDSTDLISDSTCCSRPPSSPRCFQPSTQGVTGYSLHQH